jgi:hypothetical protein
VVAAAIAADLGVYQTDLQPQVAAAAAVNALRGTLSAAASHHPRSSAAQAPSGDAGPGDEVAQPGTR